MRRAVLPGSMPHAAVCVIPVTLHASRRLSTADRTAYDDRRARFLKAKAVLVV
jgi:hypothetical protein